jgi:hypothetical protein
MSTICDLSRAQILMWRATEEVSRLKSSRWELGRGKWEVGTHGNSEFLPTGVLPNSFGVSLELEFDLNVKIKIIKFI